MGSFYDEIQNVCDQALELQKQRDKLAAEVEGYKERMTFLDGQFDIKQRRIKVLEEDIVKSVAKVEELARDNQRLERERDAEKVRANSYLQQDEVAEMRSGERQAPREMSDAIGAIIDQRHWLTLESGLHLGSSFNAGKLPLAAAAYAVLAGQHSSLQIEAHVPDGGARPTIYRLALPQILWPFIRRMEGNPEGVDRRTMLARAAAFLVAEMEQLDLQGVAARR